MYNLNRQLLLSFNLLIVAVVLCCTSGCMTPYNRYGYGSPYSGGYAQPNYAPAPANNSTPGSLYIPPSQSAPYAPGSLGTYESDPPKDDFDKSDSKPFYGTEDTVPNPQPLRNKQFNEELRGPTTSTTPSGADFGSAGGIRQVSGSYQQLSDAVDYAYGFDTNEYRSLTGILRYNSASESWTINYSMEASDRYFGTLPLSLSTEQLQGLSEGDNVDVFGRVDNSVRDRSGKPVYRVSSISRI